MSRERRSTLERALRLVTDVRAGEGLAGLVLLASVFLLLVSYYFIKPARDGLLASAGIERISPTELKAYMSFGQSLVLLAAVPMYARVSGTRGAARRCRQFVHVAVFFIANLLGFWALQPGWLVEEIPYLGLVFYVWVGIFNVVMIAQFWSFAADLYGHERGKRIFPLIALGATGGAVTGSWLADRLLAAGLVGSYSLLLVAAGFLSATALLLFVAEIRGVGDDAPPAEASAANDGAIRLVLGNGYLLAVALLILLLNWVNTNGESLLFGAVQEIIREESGGALGREALRDATTAFYADFFFWVNLCALVIQAFLTSRLLRYGGVPTVVLALPLIALLSYSTMALVPVLAIIRLMKIAENSVNYSVNNTALQVLWLATSREAKYRAKAVTDTIFVRLGDGFSALTMFVGIQLLALPLRPFFVLNVALVGLWIALAVFLARENRRLVGQTVR